MAIVHHFPDFMKNPSNAVASSSQSPGVQGYVFDGADGSQMAFWECRKDGVSGEHTHDFDEYFVVLEGRYTLIIDGERIRGYPRPGISHSEGRPPRGGVHRRDADDPRLRGPEGRAEPLTRESDAAQGAHAKRISSGIYIHMSQ